MHWVERKFVYDILLFIDAFVTAIIVAISPWLTINLVGYYLFKGKYTSSELQKVGGLYWYGNGLNYAAVLSWIAAVVIGSLFSYTALFQGPFVNYVGGMDISFLSSAIAGAVLYYIFARKDSAVIRIEMTKAGF
ncbi:cytosine permease [Eoetvoesiella caeni]